MSFLCQDECEMIQVECEGLARESTYRVFSTFQKIKKPPKYFYFTFSIFLLTQPIFVGMLRSSADILTSPLFQGLGCSRKRR